MLSRFQKYSSPRGFTLLEATIVLAILGIVTAGIWVASASAIAADKRKRLAEDVITTVSNIRDYVKNVDVPTGTTVTTTNIMALGLFPNDTIRNGTPFTPYNTNLTAQYTANNITIGIANIPSDACVDLLYSHFGGTQGGNLPLDMGFIGYTSSTGTSSDVTFATVTSVCATSSSSTISLIFSD